MEIRASNFSVSLSSLGMADAAGIAANANDYEITRNVARMGDFPFPYTMENALSFIAGALEMQAAGREFHFAIRLDGETIGACAFVSMDRDGREGEIGYWIGRRYWGMGHAKEALMLLMGFGFGRLELNSIRARAFRSNERSIKLLSSLGFSESGGEGAKGDEASYSILKNDYVDTVGLEITGE